jgi:superfamily II RNA helicase
LTKAERKKLDQAEKDERARKKMEKEVAKALKGPSKKVQDIISKKDSAKEEKVLSEDDNYLEKLAEELKLNRIKTVYDAANWIVIITSPENKMKGFELLFMEITDQILRKIIYVEILRRTSIEQIESKRFKEALMRFGRTFPTSELIKFQLKEMEDIIPPFSPFERKKMCLDSWQIDVFKYINQKFSILIDAPTASGKTVCATYCVTVCEKVLFVLPSKELANQVAGVIRNMKTPTTTFTPIKLITGENIYEDVDPKVYIGTAVDLERYFNLENAQRIRKGQRERGFIGSSAQFNIDTFDYIIVDEIHQMNSPDQGCAMQRLIKRFKCPMLGLSATIGNPEELQSWITYLKETTPNREVKRVSYDKRFINQQKHVWDGSELKPIHPLCVITLEELQSGKLTRTEMQFIPKDLFALYDQMEKLYPRDAIASVVPENFFENACIGLNECKGYETVMKQLLTTLSQTYPEQTSRLLDAFFIGDINLETLGPKDLYHVLKQMQHSKKLPAIIFKFDPTTCKKVANDLLEWMELEEQIKYPLYRETRELQSQHYKEMKIKIEEIDKVDFGKSDDVKSDKLDRENRVKDTCLKEFVDQFQKLVGHNVHKYSNELTQPNLTPERRARLEFYIAHYTKEMKDIDKMRELRDINVFAPHPDFTFSNVSICMSTMIEIRNLLKEYTAQIAGEARLTKKKLTNNFNIGYNHFFLRSIERGFVLYLNILPVPFQRIGQMLIADGGAPITFSDESLAFGVNYPIRSVGLLGSTANDIIDKAKADQASGRSGRRGLDTKGHTIYIGVNWKELTSSEYIKVRGANPDNEYMSLPHEFNTKFDVRRLSLVSLGEFCDIRSTVEDQDAQTAAIQSLQTERMQTMRDTHKELVERLGIKNFMNVYRLSEYGVLGETIIDFLLFLSGKMYSGIAIEKYDLFEMIGTIVDNFQSEELKFSNEQNATLMYEFQADMGSKGVMVELYGYNTLTRGYKKCLFDENISLCVSRLRHLNEIVRILYNQTHTMSKSNKWVGMLLSIFDEVKTQIFKNII